MRTGRGWVPVVAVTVVLGGATACFPPRRSWIGDGCRPVRVDVEPVTGMTADDIVFAARVTTGGEPLVGHVVRFAIRGSEAEGIIWGQAAPTGPDGRAAADLADSIRRLRIAREAFDRGSTLQAEYRNPAETGQAEPPGWCSTKVRIPFDPAR